MGIVQDTFSDYYDAIFDTNREKALEAVNTAVKRGIRPEAIIFEVVVPSVERILTDMTEKHDATLAQHYICSKVAGEVTEAMVPLFDQKHEGHGTVVLGTARGDFHGLGKKIVAGCLKANLFDVHDLGTNVSPEKFVSEAVRLDAGVIGVSAMMVHTATGEQGAIRVCELLKQQGLAGKIKLIVGGAPYRFDPGLYKTVGADAWAENGPKAIEMISSLMK
ncbi:MAG: cobalamin B12-binding domain-containing protein [Thermodesulfobacteriota bacterium]